MNEMREPLLQIENLSTHFHMFKGTVKAVDGVSFSLNQGEILGVVGESGSGKSTLAKMVLKLLEAGSGNISLGGENLSVYDKRKKGIQKDGAAYFPESVYRFQRQENRGQLFVRDSL